MYNYSGQYAGSVEPPTFSSASFNYWERSFFQRARGLWNVDGLPDGAPGQVQTDKDAFWWGLLHLGYLTVFKTKQYGVTFQPSAPHGVGLQYQPWGMVVSSPFFQFSRPLVIGRECENIKLTPDFTGLWDIITKYATEMQYIDIAIRQAMLNARMPYIAAAANDNEARTLKAFFERVSNGEPYIIYNRNLKKPIAGDAHPELPWAQFDRDLSKSFLLPELQQCRRNIITAFYRELGVPVASDKRERENQLESSINAAEFFNRRQVWQDCLDESSDRVNRMYGLNIKFTYKGGNINALSDPNAQPAE